MKKINLVLFLPKKETSLVRSFLQNKNKFLKICNIILIVGKNNKFSKKYKIISNKKKNNHKIINYLNSVKNLPKENLYGLILQYPWIVKENLIRKFHFIMNCHFGRLPNYRGHNTISHSILNKDKFIYGTIHKIESLVDSGKILNEIRIKSKNLSVREIEQKLSEAFIKNLIIIFKKIQKKIKIKEFKIKESKHKKNKFYKIDEIYKYKQINHISEIPDKFRAMKIDDYEPAYFKIKNKKYYLFQDDRWD